jgi:hypothetical protein
VLVIVVLIHPTHPAGSLARDDAHDLASPSAIRDGHIQGWYAQLVTDVVDEAADPMLAGGVYDKVGGSDLLEQESLQLRVDLAPYLKIEGGKCGAGIHVEDAAVDSLYFGGAELSHPALVANGVVGLQVVAVEQESI